MYHFLIILQAVLVFLFSSLVQLITIPLTVAATKTKSALFGGDYHAEVAEAIEVIETLKRNQPSGAKELAQLERASVLLRKSSSSSLSALAEPKTLQVL